MIFADISLTFSWHFATFRWLSCLVFFQAKPKDSVYKIQLRDIFNFPHVLSDDLISITVFSTFSSRRISRVIHERFPYIEGTSFYSIHSPIWYLSKIWTVKAQLEKKTIWYYWNLDKIAVKNKNKTMKSCHTILCSEYILVNYRRCCDITSNINNLWVIFLSRSGSIFVPPG